MTLKKRLGEMLLEAGVIDETQLLSALGHQRKWGGRLGQALIDLKLATEAQIVTALARKFGYEVVSVGSLQPSPALDAALKLVPGELALRHTLLPIAATTSTLAVAMGDPSNIAVVDELSFRTGRRVKVALAGDREIAAAVRRLYFPPDEKHEPIAIEDGAREAPIETTRDPFAAMPDHIREGYFNRPAPAVDPAAPGPSPFAPRSGDPRPSARGQPAQPSLDQPTFTPPPVLARPGPGAPVAAPPPFDAAPREEGASQLDEGTPEADLGEPVLATDLLVGDEDPFDGAEGEGPPSPREAALLDALDRLARGEESPLLRPGQVAAVLIRLLLARGVVSRAELLEELMRVRPA